MPSGPVFLVTALVKTRTLAALEVRKMQALEAEWALADGGARDMKYTPSLEG